MKNESNTNLWRTVRSRLSAQYKYFGVHECTNSAETVSHLYK